MQLTCKLILLFILLRAAPLQAQQPAVRNGKKVLLTFGFGREVTVGEFDHVYAKNHAMTGAPMSGKDLDEYLQLYIDFALKAKNGEDLGIDATPEFAAELDKYTRQLQASQQTAIRTGSANAPSDAEVAGQIAQYRSGILIFEVMNDNVWSKAVRDTFGLHEFYTAHRTDYDDHQSWEELRPAVVADYQVDLEARYVAELRKRYPFKIHRRAYKKYIRSKNLV
jgi:hypothetical protein